ncbi:MAG: hypothetical protein HYY84_01210 [Deltaproteobacteria bacterium]|nr:hypothetical protein [Deltaproteobacteria bacterium]
MGRNLFKLLFSTAAALALSVSVSAQEKDKGKDKDKEKGGGATTASTGQAASAADSATLHMLVVEAEPSGTFDPKLDSLKARFTELFKGLKGFRRSAEHALKFEVGKEVSIELPHKLIARLVLRKVVGKKAEVDFTLVKKPERKTGLTQIVLPNGKEFFHVYKRGDLHVILVLKVRLK